jgi:hypothetical protein
MRAPIFVSNEHTSARKAKEMLGPYFSIRGDSTPDAGMEAVVGGFTTGSIVLWHHNLRDTNPDI